MRQSLVVGEIVDRDDLEGSVLFESGSEEVPTDTSEAVDTYLDHFNPISIDSGLSARSSPTHPILLEVIFDLNKSAREVRSGK
jgi:hypothetical protein